MLDALTVWISCIHSHYWHGLTHSASVHSCTADNISLAQVCMFFVITSFVCNTLWEWSNLLFQLGYCINEDFFWLEPGVWGLNGLGLVATDQRDCNWLDTAHITSYLPPLLLCRPRAVQTSETEISVTSLQNSPGTHQTRGVLGKLERPSWTPVLTLLMENQTKNTPTAALSLSLAHIFNFIIW